MEEDLHAIFNEADWIKARKLYDMAIPSFVALEKNNCMAIPQGFCRDCRGLPRGFRSL